VTIHVKFTHTQVISDITSVHEDRSYETIRGSNSTRKGKTIDLRNAICIVGLCVF
jgi:hypothetical protein